MKVQNTGFSAFSTYMPVMGVPTNADRTTFSPTPKMQSQPSEDSFTSLSNLYVQKTEAELLEDLRIDDAISKTNKLGLYKKCQNNKNFQNIVNNEIFQKDLAKKDLIDIVYALDKKQKECEAIVSAPGYMCPYIPDANRMYAGISIEECLINLDKFYNSKLDKNTKIFITEGTDKLKDIWFVHTNLGSFDKNNPEIRMLTTPFYMQ